METELIETEKEIDIRKQILDHFGKKIGSEIIVRSECSKEMLFIEEDSSTYKSPYDNEEELEYWYKKLGVA